MSQLRGVQELLDHVPCNARHPGLALDKFSLPGNQEDQKKTLGQIQAAKGFPDLLRERGTVRDIALSDSGATTWDATTSGPLTLHLSRANALENAGIALHPLYGFAYLPGSGLKGAARAYAETIWLATQPDPEAARARIIEVFGCAPGSDEDMASLPASRRDSSAGAVVFHDAWPKTWPGLLTDIAAIHHPDYYQASEPKVPPPGDWETPSLIYFLAIQPGTTFRFALAPRVRTADAALVAQAKDWLNAALVTLGVGAKTATGYGLFKTDFAPPAMAPSKRAEAQFELKLVTPAFLAGAAQKQEDCELRGATLRGQLRWWWRTLHAAHLEPVRLRRLEAAVWGASSEGSAVQIWLTAGSSPPAESFSYRPNDIQFLGNNGIEPSNSLVADDQKKKTTQGLFYAAYGAGTDGGKPGRFFRQPGSTWSLGISARPSAYRSAVDADVKVLLPAKDVLRQSEAALFLLTRYGGVGAKGRKGFGSFDDVTIPGIKSIDDCKSVAAAFRAICGLQATSQFQTDAPSLELMSTPVVVPTKWTNAWFALNRVGEALQAYSKTGKHQVWKSALGLPRKGDRGPLQVRLPFANGNMTRHAAPVHFHIGRSGETLAVRLVTFVSPHLPSRNISETRLAALRDHVQRLIDKQSSQGGTAAVFPKIQMAQSGPEDSKPRVGGRVRAELLAEKTKNGGWRAKHLESGEVRSIQNSRLVPLDKKAGDIVELEVPNNSEFKWPVPPPPVQTASPPRGGPRRQR